MRRRAVAGRRSCGRACRRCCRRTSPGPAAPRSSRSRACTSGRRRRPAAASSAARSRCARRRPTRVGSAGSAARVVEDAEQDRADRRCTGARSSRLGRPRLSAMPPCTRARARSLASCSRAPSARSPGTSSPGTGCGRAAACPARTRGCVVGQLGAEVEALLPVGPARGQLAAEREPAAPRAPPSAIAIAPWSLREARRTGGSASSRRGRATRRCRGRRRRRSRVRGRLRRSHGRLRRARRVGR